MGPIRPACQKCTSELSEMRCVALTQTCQSYEPADPCAANLYDDLSFIQGCPRLDICSRWLRLVEPQIVFWVSVYTDVRFDIRKRRHRGRWEREREPISFLCVTVM
jgi:hypothetical protein